MKKPTHMTNGIGLRQQIKFGDVGDYNRSGLVEGQSEKYIEYTVDVIYYIIILPQSIMFFLLSVIIRRVYIFFLGIFLSRLVNCDNIIGRYILIITIGPRCNIQV